MVTRSPVRARDAAGSGSSTSLAGRLDPRNSADLFSGATPSKRRGASEDTRRALARSPFAPPDFAHPRVPSPAPAWGDAHGALAEVLVRDEQLGGRNRLLDWMAEAGVDMNPVWARSYVATALPVTWISAGGARFDLSRDATAPIGIIIEIRDRTDEAPIDLMAFSPSVPGHMATMFGRVDLLDAWSACNPATYHLGRPLRLHRDPLGWIRGGCRGSVLLRPDRAWSGLPELPGPVLVDDLDHGRELARLTRGYLDPAMIRVPSDG